MEMYLNGTKQIISFVAEEWKMIIFLTVIFLLYFYYTNTFEFFKKKGIPFLKPTILFGNLGPRIRAKISFHQFQLVLYNNFKGQRYGGMFEGRRPILIIMDPDLIKIITIRDFDYFTDGNSFSSREPRYLSRSLINLKGSDWKAVRSTLTPVFSSARLKNMLPLVELCSQQLVTFLKQCDNKDLEMKQTMGHFTLEVIGACAFGIKGDALTHENAHFLKVAEKFDYMPKLKRILIFAILILMPTALRFINISFLNLSSTDELMRILNVAKTERRLSGSKKNDFLQLLIDFADKEKKEVQETKTKLHLNEDTIDAQALLFLIAGYETSSTLLSFAIHVLATNPEIQSKLRDHVKDITDGEEITYDLLAQLTYLDGFLLETLRMYPPVSRVDRVCTKPYIIPGTSVKLDVGNVVAIPVYGIHMDPDYYPDPYKFKPERFLKDEKKERPSHLFLAFGAGPRNCIGLRFAMISAKIAMISLLKNFKFSVCDKTIDPVRFDKRALLLKAEGGLWVRIDSI